MIYYSFENNIKKKKAEEERASGELPPWMVEVVVSKNPPNLVADTLERLAPIIAEKKSQEYLIAKVVKRLRREKN